MKTCIGTNDKANDNDLFEDLRSVLQYDYVSDLKNMNKNLENNLDYALLKFNPNDYSVGQWQNLSYYLFPHLTVVLPTEPELLRNNLILAIREYRKIANMLSELKTKH